MRNIQLKRIEFSERLSEETYAYVADVWLDGKLFAHVKNDGHGGCDYQHPAKGVTHQELEALDKEIRATYPKQQLGISSGEPYHVPMEIEQTLESVCHELLTDWLKAKDEKRIDATIKRTIAKTVVFYDPARDGIFTMKAKVVEQHGKIKVIEALQRKNPNARVLNDMPLDKAIALYREKAVK